MTKLAEPTNGPSLVAVITHEAINLADELDQIRSIYGEECCASVKNALFNEPTNDWHDTVNRAVSGWANAAHRGDLGSILQ